MILLAASRTLIAPSTLDFSNVSGDLMLVTFAGQGVIKKIPISSGLSPVSRTASSLASIAAASMGETRLNTCSKSSGKRSLISLKTAGQAELITGLFKFPVLIFSLVAALMYSAPLATSNTWSKPIFKNAFK